MADAAFSVPAHDLVLLVVEGEDKKPAEYLGKESNIGGIQATTGPTIARLQYANTSGHVAVVGVKSTSGLSIAQRAFYGSLAWPVEMRQTCVGLDGFR